MYKPEGGEEFEFISSMELRHPDMDNSSPVAWADSDESNKAQFQKFTYTDIFDRVTWSPLTSTPLFPLSLDERVLL